MLLGGASGGDLSTPWLVVFGIALVVALIVVVRMVRWRVMALDDEQLLETLRQRREWGWMPRVFLAVMMGMFAWPLFGRGMSLAEFMADGGRSGAVLGLATLLAWLQWDHHWIVDRLDDIADDG